jgi:hypothetical protein
MEIEREVQQRRPVDRSPVRAGPVAAAFRGVDLGQRKLALEQLWVAAQMLL